MGVSCTSRHRQKVYRYRDSPYLEMSFWSKTKIVYDSAKKDLYEEFQAERITESMIFNVHSLVFCKRQHYSIKKVAYASRIKI